MSAVRLHFHEVAKLINHTTTTEIDTKKPVSSGAGWDLFEGENTVTSFNYKFYILYLYNTFRKDAAREAASAVVHPSKHKLFTLHLSKRVLLMKLGYTLELTLLLFKIYDHSYFRLFKVK